MERRQVGCNGDVWERHVIDGKPFYIIAPKPPRGKLLRYAGLTVNRFETWFKGRKLSLEQFCHALKSGSVGTDIKAYACEDHIIGTTEYKTPMHDICVWKKPGKLVGRRKLKINGGGIELRIKNLLNIKKAEDVSEPIDIQLDFELRGECHDYDLRILYRRPREEKKYDCVLEAGARILNTRDDLIIISHRKVGYSSLPEYFYKLQKHERNE